jgi:hypothetical protein
MMTKLLEDTNARNLLPTIEVENIPSIRARLNRIIIVTGKIGGSDSRK